MSIRLSHLLYLPFAINFFLCQQIIIQDEFGNPIEDAYVVFNESKLWSKTNIYGIADISSIRADDKKIIIKRYGFEDFHLDKSNEEIIVVLKKKPIIFDPVIKEGKFLKYLKNTRSNHIYKTVGQKSISHKDFLELLPGLSIRKLGGPGSITTVSINGGPTSQTKVEINGFEITNMQTGVTDLSQIPSALIEGARIITDGKTTLGSGSQNGVLSLDISRPNNSIYISKGSFDSNSNYAQYSFHKRKINTQIMVGQQFNKGNYPVSWRQSNFKRTNNFFNQRFTAIQINTILSSNLFFKSFGFISNQNRGIPGLIWSPLEASHKDQIAMFASEVKRYSIYGETEIKLMHKQAKEFYSNPAYSITSQNKINTLNTQINHTFNFNNTFKTNFGLVFENQNLTSSNYNHNENNFTEFIDFQINLPKYLFISPSLRRIHSRKKIDKTTYSTIIAYKPVNSILKNLSISKSSHFRNPTFNDLYWIPGGNSNLMPEFGNNTNSNLKILLPYLGSFNFYLFNSKTENMIQWLPIQTYWKASNINKVNRSGFTIHWVYQIEYFKSTFSFSSIYSKNEKNNLPLRYTPENLSTIKIDWMPTKKWIISTQLNYTDEMISMYSYPENNILPANTISSIYLSREFHKYNFNILPTISILNIENNQYDASKGYPEEGRSFKFSLKITQKRTKKYHEKNSN